MRRRVVTLCFRTVHAAMSHWFTRSRNSFGVKFMHVRPLHDRILVRRLEEGEQNIGGIIIPDTAKEKPQRGEVISAGNGKVKDDGKRIPLDVKAGDLILFGKYTSQEVKLDRKSTRLNSSHLVISYAVFCLKKKKIIYKQT